MPKAKSIVTAIPLRNVSVAYQAPEYVADQVFPLMDINDPTAKITKILPSDFFRDDCGTRGEGGAASRGSYKTTEVTYSCVEYAFASPVTDELRRNSNKMSGQPLQPDITAVELCKRKILMNREGKVMSLIVAGTWADGNSGGEDAEGNWNASATTNTFITDMYTAKNALAAKGIVAGGDLELRLLLDQPTFDQICQISAIKDQFKYTSAESITPDMLAGLLQIDKVIISKAVKNTATETKTGTEFTTGRFFQSTLNKGVAFLYAYPKSIKPQMMCAGLCVRDKFDTSEGGGFERIVKFREDGNHQDVYEVAENRDEVQLVADAGYLFKDTITT